MTQDNIDCELIGIQDHPDFEILNPENLNISNDQNQDSIYRKIELMENTKLADLTRKLDSDQRKVVDKVVAYAKDIVKPKLYGCPNLTPPMIIVQGGAGTGKSMLINVVTQQVEKILRKPGDNPGHPYILKLAYTGTAAANIKGQTLHSALSFNFGNAYMSLNDKARDEKRTVLQNLTSLVIDIALLSIGL